MRPLIEKIDAGTRDRILEELQKRSAGSYPEQEAAVEAILKDVRERGDEALFDYCERFDKVRLDAASVRVTSEEIEEAYASVDPEMLRIIRRSIERLTAFHLEQKSRSWFTCEDSGMVLGQRVIPMERAGVYVPGGKAAYPSSVLMNIIPAKVAGVGEIIMCTPPMKDGKVSPLTLAAAKEAGADAIYKVGGAQAIAAMAYGTASVPKVDKITGPGNIYVALAKRAVFGHTSIDSVAGPSEITVLADETADPTYVAADLISQAEHDELASSILVTTCEELAERTAEEIERICALMPRSEIIEASLKNFGHILVAQDLNEAVATVNAIAPEHLEIQTKDAFLVMTKIRNAGAIFVGDHSSEPLGDYMAGPNHILPTNGTARFFSALSVDDFVKKSSIIYSSREALADLAADISTFARNEGLFGHAASVDVRFGDIKN